MVSYSDPLPTLERNMKKTMRAQGKENGKGKRPDLGIGNQKCETSLSIDTVSKRHKSFKRQAFSRTLNS